jgi:ribonuclease BN (tRNA processing enzyme)
MAKSARDLFRVTLLGTGAPPPSLDRFGPSTLIEVGNEKFIVDAGRGAMQRIYQLGILSRRLRDCFSRTTIPTTSWAFPISG